MEFCINGLKWIVKKKSSQDILNGYKDTVGDEINYLFGYTDFTRHEIWINKDTCFDQQCMTLAHEITHAWMFNSGMYYIEKFQAETVCEIVTNCHTLVYETIEQYKKEMKD